jgi:lactate dehydrogenase-like 2-hydroxyacid dehydrogenase
VSIDQLLREADFITLHVPLTATTKRLIGGKELEKLKPTARIINCARGGIVNETDLFEALKSGKVAGAAFDVWDFAAILAQFVRVTGGRIQAQVVNLLEDLQERFNLTYLFIAHDLRVVPRQSTGGYRRLAQRVPRI